MPSDASMHTVKVQTITSETVTLKSREIVVRGVMG